MHAHKKLEKTLSLHLSLIPRTQTFYDNKNKKEHPGRGKKSDLQNYPIIIFQCPVFYKIKKKKITRYSKKQRSIAYSKEKINQKTLSLRNSACQLLDKIFFWGGCLLGPYPQHMEVPKLGVESEL